MTTLPAGSTTAPATARPMDLVRAFVRSPIEAASWWATIAIIIGLFVAVAGGGLLSAAFSTGGSLLIWLVGIPIIAIGLEVARIVARVERWRVRLVDGRPLAPHPYRPLGGLPRAPYAAWVRTWAEAQFLDASRWRDVLYVLILLVLAPVEFVVSIGLWLTALTLLAVPVGVALMGAADVALLRNVDLSNWTGLLAVSLAVGAILVPVAASVSRGLMTLHRAVVQGLLCVDPTDALRRDVERLRDSRSAALELEASELRRIERDLHDGAQQRLVSLVIDLGRAEERIDTDPAAAKAIVVAARADARRALAELRDLVRGTMPAILVDRGLEAALASVAAGNRVPTTIDSGLAPGERLPAAVERAAYFVVVEALANVAKHSDAGHCEVILRRASTVAPAWGPPPPPAPWSAAQPALATLAIEVRDDGVGGASIGPGGGLEGLRDRAQALDGTLTISSPAGGPTILRVELPLGPS